MELVPDEWLLEWLRPGSSRQGQANEFLDKLKRNCDCLRVWRGSPFTRKLYRYAKSYQNHVPPPYRVLFLLMRDSSKIHLVDENELQPLPGTVQVPEDDAYLARLAYSSPDKTLLTTDNPLQEQLDSSEGIKVVLTEQFLSSYLTE